MSALFDVIFKSLKNKLPTISWKFGSVVRTLVADPLEVVGSEIDNYVETLEKKNNLTTILADPYNYGDELDAWLERLNIAIPETTASTGTVLITFTGTEQLTVPTGTVFSWGDQASVSTAESYVFGGATGKALKKLTTNLYQVEVPVSTRTGEPVTISSGAPLNWASAPSRVQDIYVGSAITGGYTATPSIKAAMLRQALNNPSTCGKDAMLTALIRNFGPVIADVLPGPRNITYGRSANSLYIKQTELPRIMGIPVAATEVQLTENGVSTTKLQFKVDTTGAAAVLGIYNQNMIDTKAVHTASYGTLGDYGSTQTFIADPVTPGITVNDSYIAKVLRYNVVEGCAEWLNAYQTGSPSTVITKIPIFCELYMQLRTDSGTAPTATLSAIVDYVNNSALNSVITDSYIDTILNIGGVTRTAPTLFIAKLTYGEYTNSHTNSSSINVAELLGAPAAPVAIYTSLNNISVS